MKKVQVRVFADAIDNGKGDGTKAVGSELPNAEYVTAETVNGALVLVYAIPEDEASEVSPGVYRFDESKARAKHRGARWLDSWNVPRTA